MRRFIYSNSQRLLLWSMCFGLVNKILWLTYMLFNLHLSSPSALYLTLALTWERINVDLHLCANVCVCVCVYRPMCVCLCHLWGESHRLLHMKCYSYKAALAWLSPCHSTQQPIGETQQNKSQWKYVLQISHGMFSLTSPPFWVFNIFSPVSECSPEVTKEVFLFN